ncbi:MAG: DUF1828 domain-containing protein [Alphaproteobacteria bacterium]
MFTIEEIKKKLEHSALVENIDALPKGHIRIATGFLYPDGSSIDVFLPQLGNGVLPNLHKPHLTDFGNTSSWLQNFEMKPNRTISQKTWFNRILELYRCRLNGAALECELENLDDISSGIVRLGQACLRTADLVYSKRFRAQSTFNQEVEETIASINNDYQTDAEIPLQTGNIIKVDFRIKGKQRETAVLTWPTGNSQSAHYRANEIYVRWDDIINRSDWTKMGGQCVTVLDDRSDIYDAKDLERLARKSIVLPFSNVETLSDVLRAA